MSGHGGTTGGPKIIRMGPLDSAYTEKVPGCQTDSNQEHQGDDDAYDDIHRLQG